MLITQAPMWLSQYPDVRIKSNMDTILTDRNNPDVHITSATTTSDEWSATTTFQCPAALGMWTRCVGADPKIKIPWGDPSFGDRYRLPEYELKDISSDGICFYKLLSVAIYGAGEK